MEPNAFQTYGKPFGGEPQKMPALFFSRLVLFFLEPNKAGAAFVEPQKTPELFLFKAGAVFWSQRSPRCFLAWLDP